MAPRSFGVVVLRNKDNREYVKGENLLVMNVKNEKMEDLRWVSKQFTDREPGELSSENSSGIEDGVKGSEEKDEISSSKKRKFSILDWDMNEQKNKFLKQNAFEHISAKNIRKAEGLLENGDFTEQMGGDYVAANTISFSRWADKNDSLGGVEGGTSDLAPAQDRRLMEPGEFIASGDDGLCREACLKPREDDTDSLDISGENSDREESDGSLEGGSVERTDRSINMFNDCRTVDEFEKLDKINEGTYGIVYRAKDKRSGEIVALKKVKMEKEREGFPITSLREINILLSLQHPSIVEVKEVVVGRDLNCVFTVMEYMDHDLKGLIETMKKPFHLSEIKCLMLQLFAGVKYLHDNWVLHRDLKTSNLLFNNRGELKICDFGLSRQYGSPLKPYTKLVVTLWYRAPELLLGAKEYSTAIDMWSLGCIMAELLTKEPLFPGKSELDQLDKIFRILGTPDEKIWPGFSGLPGAKVNFVKKPFKLQGKFPRMAAASFLGRPSLSAAGFNLLTKLLTYDPEMRITAEDALNHPWFHESPLPTTKDFMPTFPPQHRQDRHWKRIMNSPDPLERLIRKDSQ